MKKLFVMLGVFWLITSFAPKNELSWMAIGDSITYLNGKPAETKNRITKGYMDRVVENCPIFITPIMVTEDGQQKA